MEDGQVPLSSGSEEASPMLLSREERVTKISEEPGAPKWSATQVWVRSRLGGLSADAKSSIMKDLQDELNTLPIPKADTGMASSPHLRWDLVDSSKLTSEREIALLGKQDDKHPGMSKDLALQQQYRGIAAILAPSIKALTLLKEGQVDAQELVNILSDGIELGTDSLYAITQKRRENMFTRDKALMSRFAAYYPNEDNYDREELPDKVFGNTFMQGLYTEMKDTSEHLDIRKNISGLGARPKQDNRRRIVKFSNKNFKPVRYVKYNTGSSNLISLVPPIVDGFNLLNRLGLPLVSGTLTEGMRFYPYINVLGGRLTFFIGNWKLISSDPTILSLVSGHKIGFFSKPNQSEVYSHPGKFCQGMHDHVSNLLKEGVIEEAWEIGLKSPIFFKRKPNGSYRLILNLRVLNESIEYNHFKMQTLQSALQLVASRDFFLKIDLKSAYDAVPIHKNDRKFLQFKFGDKVFQFRGWPNGLCEAPRLFKKLLKPVMALLGRLSMRVVSYLDDFLLVNHCPVSLLDEGSIVIQLLSWLGFIINVDKSVLVPTQQIEFLGFIINSRDLSLSLPKRRVDSILGSCKNLLPRAIAPVREVASLVGKMQAACPAVLPAALHYRALQKQVSQVTCKGNWKVSVKISPSSKVDMKWWIGSLRIWNHRHFFLGEVDLEILSDASLTGWGATCQGEKTQGPWVTAERKFHINVLELMAAQRAILALVPPRRNIWVRMSLDNTVALSAISKMGGSKSEQINIIAREIWEWCLVRGITLTAKHIPGRLNVIADKESRVMKDSSDWKILPAIFQKICLARGPLVVDLFASHWNHQLPRFFSWGKQPGSLGTDALTQIWSQGGSYAFPPFALIPAILRKLVREKVKVVLVTPVWPTQHWYGVLLSKSIDFPLLLPRVENLLLNAQEEPHPLLKQKAFCLAAWTLSGAESEIVDFHQKLQTSSPELTESRLSQLMVMPGRSGVAGVVRGKPLFFQKL